MREDLPEPKAALRQVSAAWEDVLGDAARLGADLASRLRDAYAAEAERDDGTVATADAAPTSPTDEVQRRAEHAVRAVRHAFDDDESRERLADEGRELSRRIESATRVTLAELGAFLTRLSESLGDDARPAA
jgi:hypothetical protein